MVGLFVGTAARAIAAVSQQHWAAAGSSPFAFTVSARCKRNNRQEPVKDTEEAMCPNCRSLFTTVHQTFQESPIIRRRRYCHTCELSFQTYELSAAEWAQRLEDAWRLEPPAATETAAQYAKRVLDLSGT